MGVTTKSKKIAIISPYLDILGGGERYILSIASLLSKENQVVIFWDDQRLKNQAFSKFGVDLSKVDFHKRVYGFIKLTSVLSSFDQLYYMTDGSLFISPCKDNYLIIQSPAHIPKNNPANRFKLSRFKKIICYSDYVAKFVRSRLNKNVHVLPPPIDMPSIKPTRKQDIILSVGRFFPHLHSKRQAVLVKVFKKMVDQNLIKDWQLILAGSVDLKADEYLKDIIRLAKGYPIKIINNISFDDLSDLYNNAKIYWHASGYGQDLEKHPENVEHFGITTVEAMTMGCVPVVYNGGGQKEIVENNINGFLWNTEDELIAKTINLITNKRLMSSLSLKAKEKSEDYSLTEFNKKLESII